MITKIKLKNWKSHLDSELDFSKGVNALIGINGSGKSSILDAISFSLFGTFPNHNNRKIGLDDLIMARPGQKEEAEVYLEFFSSGKKYSILRKIKKGKGTVLAEIREDGKLIEVNPNGVTEHIEKILQIDYPLFSKAVYSEQNNIDYFLTIPKGKRMQHIDKMLKLDRIDFIKECAGSMKNSFDNKTEEKMKILTELRKENIEDSLKICSSEIENLQKKGVLLEIKLTDIMSQKDRLNKVFSEAEAKNNRIIELNKLLQGLKASEKEVREGLEEKIGSTRSLDKDSILETIEATRAQIAGLENEVKGKKASLEAFRDTVAGFTAQIKNLSENLSDLEKVNSGRCPICESELQPEKKSHLKEIKGKAVVEARKNQENVIKDMGSVKKEIESIENSIKEKSREMDKLNYKLGDFNIIERLNNKIRILELEIERFENERLELEKDAKKVDLKDLKEGLFELNKNLGETTSEIRLLDNSIRREKSILDGLNKRFSLIKMYETDAEVYSKMSNCLDGFVKALKLTQSQLREEFTKTVNSIMSGIWPALYAYNDFTDIRLSIKDSDYVLETKNQDSWINVDGFASGGERTLACLALRVAFSLAFIPNLKWLILDEPTHNLDSNSVKQFSSALDQNIGSYVNQIFLITHEARIAEDIEGPVYKIERDKSVNGSSRVVKV